MNAKKSVLVLVVAMAGLFGGLSPNAHGLHFRHNSNVVRVHKAKKNTSPYAYLKGKKQKKAKPTYRSPVTGEWLYGKQKK